jgi:lipoprotein-anchoring transpeptidase ErfK/SrfK
MSARRTRARIVASALVLALAVGIVPAFAADGPPVVSFSVTVLGHDLVGKTAEEAAGVIAAECATPTLAPLAIDATGTPFRLEVSSAVALDIDGMVADALAATEATTMAPRWTADATAISGFVSTVAHAIARSAVNAKRTIVNHKFKVAPEVVGRTLDTAGSTAALTGAVTAEIAAGGSAQATVTVPVLAKNPKVTRANIGKTIVVVLHERRVYLYKNAKLEKSYRCAIGMARYPTPRGLFKVIAKSPRPTWRNPGSAWAKGMPSFIKPGYYNPLGLRALYINSSGIRIHGTAKTWSMGHAASHGCIRLTNKNVVDIYPRVPVGTPVYILK